MAIQKKSLTGKSAATTVPTVATTKGKTKVAAPKVGKLETTMRTTRAVPTSSL